MNLHGLLERGVFEHEKPKYEEIILYGEVSV